MNVFNTQFIWDNTPNLICTDLYSFYYKHLFGILPVYEDAAQENGDIVYIILTSKYGGLGYVTLSGKEIVKARDVGLKLSTLKAC